MSDEEGRLSDDIPEKSKTTKKKKKAKSKKKKKEIKTELDNNFSEQDEE